jgi:hypothetical protein
MAISVRAGRQDNRPGLPIVVANAFNAAVEARNAVLKSLCSLMDRRPVGEDPQLLADAHASISGIPFFTTTRQFLASRINLVRGSIDPTTEACVEEHLVQVRKWFEMVSAAVSTAEADFVPVNTQTLTNVVKRTVRMCTAYQEDIRELLFPPLPLVAGGGGQHPGVPDAVAGAFTFTSRNSNILSIFVV